MDVTPPVAPVAANEAPATTPTTAQNTNEPSDTGLSKAASKWAVDVAPEMTLQAIAEARAYAEAHVEMVVPKRRGRPRKNPLPEGEQPPPAPVPKRVVLPKIRPPPKSTGRSRRRKKRDDSDDSEGDFVPEPRRSSSVGRRAGFFSDGDVDSEEEEAIYATAHDADIAQRLANQRVSLRARRQVNYAAQFGDDSDEEDDSPSRSTPSRGPKKTASRPRSQSLHEMAVASAADDEFATDDEDDETDEYNKPTKTGLVPDMAYRSSQIERILAFRPKRVVTSDPHSFPPPSVQPNKLAGPVPPPEGTPAMFAWIARAEGKLTDVLMTTETCIPGFVVPTPPPEAASEESATKTDAATASSTETSAPPSTTETKSSDAAPNGTAAADAASSAAAPTSSNNTMDIAAAESNQNKNSTDAATTTTATTTDGETNGASSMDVDANANPKIKLIVPKPLYPLPKPLQTHPLLHPGTQYEFLIKYKNRSFMHTEWVPQVIIERAKLGKQRLQKFLAKNPECDPDMPFELEYVEVDRVLDREERNGTMYYYVKWQGLPYSECTWESSEEVNDQHAVEEYLRHNEEPPVRVDYNAPTPRPAPGEWRELHDVQFKDDNQLRPYQREGMNWLRFCWYNRRNSILADEMGLGKTVQTVSMLWYLYKYRNIRGPFMIIAPLSTIPHWRRELENWTDLNCIVYHGNAEARQIIRNYEFHYLDDNGNPKWRNMFKFHVIVTTYEMILADSDILRPVRWKYIAIDEAHRLKNKSSRVLNEFLGFHYDHLLLLTGTPIQNNTQELWTLLNLLDPVQFSSAEDFVAAFGNLKDSEQVKRLHDILKPFLLRRIKRDVDKTIAPKEETIIEVELTTIQKKYYRAILERSFDNLVQGSRSRSALPSLLNIMMQLRKCCNHPYLLRGVEETELGLPIDENKPGASASTTALIESSGKLVLIDKLLPRLKEEGHKILVFSQMVRVIDILQEYLIARNYKFERIDGSVRGNDRQAAIDRFSKPDSDIFVFLLCTRAGGVGINLTAADTVIIFDSDWNPQNDLQAQARCHRIGQQKRVKVYRLLTRGTYERVMFERASLKLGLDQAVLSRMADSVGEGEDGGKPKFTSAEVDALLKHGAYDLFRDDDKAAEQFREANIEDILQSRTTHIVHDQSNETGSTFSKASFTSEHADTDLDVNDPDFWKKVMPHQAHKPNPNIIEQPRQRKQRARISHEILGSDEEEALEDFTDEEDAGNRESDDEAFEDFEGDKRGWRRGEKGERTRKPTGPILQRRKWNMTQRNRFVRAIQLLGFGRWREIKRNAKLANKSLWEIACYGRAYVRILLRFASLNDGDTEEKLLARIVNCEDGIEDLTEDPWRSASKRQMAAYELHKQESEEGVPPEMIKAAEERHERRLAELEVVTAKEKEFIENKLALLKEGKTEEVQKSFETVTLGGSGPSPALTMHPDLPPEELPPSEDPPITIHWHLNNSEAIEAEVEYFADEEPLMTEPRFLENTRSTASQALKRLELLSEVGQLVRTNFGEFAHQPFPKLEGGDTAFFTDKWTVTHDRDLLVGTWRWGFGQYDRMVRDPLLSYYGFYKPKPIKERGGKGDDDDEDEALADDDDAKMVKKSAKRGSAKRAGSSRKLKDDIAETPLTAASSASSTPAPPTTSTPTNAMDVDASSTATPAPDENSDLLDMPPSKLLTHRVKHILKAFSSHRKRRNQSEIKEKKRLEKEKEKEEKHRRKVDKETTWSKREKTEFARVLQANGIPLRRNDLTGELEEDWQSLHDRSALHNKSAALMQAFYPDFLVVCKYLAAVKMKGVEEKMDESLLNGMTELQMQERAQEYHITGMAARRIWERISTLDTLRREVLTQPGLDSKLARAGAPGYGFHSWWLTPQHDVALLRAVDKHGFGKWQRVCADETLPFMAAAKAHLGADAFAKLMAAANAGSKDYDDDELDRDDEDSHINTFLPPEKLLWKRVQHLVGVATGAIDVNTLGRANGKKGKPGMDVDEDVDEGNRKKRRRDAEPELPEPIAKRPSRGTAAAAAALSSSGSLVNGNGGDSEVKIEYDDQGQPIMPVSVKGVLVESLGKINPAPGFHSEKYIWPVGYVSRREYASGVNPEARTKYKCEILEGEGENAGSAWFRVTAEDDPDHPFEASSPSQAWKLVLDNVSKIKPEAKRTSVSGPEYFGFSHPKIAELIAKLPGSEACARYHAAQNPAPVPSRKKRDRGEGADDMESPEELAKRRKLEEAAE